MGRDRSCCTGCKIARKLDWAVVISIEQNKRRIGLSGPESLSHAPFQLAGSDDPVALDEERSGDRHVVAILVSRQPA